MPKRTVKILFAGFPCQGFSIAQNANKREVEPATGQGWELFKNVLYARDKFKPDFFLMENVKSMSNAIRDCIDEHLGVGQNNVTRTMINAALLSAQNRNRYYWTNFGDIEQPEDRGILLKDILESGEGFATSRDEKSYCLDACYWKGIHPDRALKSGARTQVAETLLGVDKSFTLTTSCKNSIPEDILTRHQNVIVEPLNPLGDGKARTMDAHYANLEATTWYNHVYNPNPAKQQHDYVAEPIRTGTIENAAKNKSHDSKQYRVYSPEGKSTTLCGEGGGLGAKTGLYATPEKGKKRGEKIIYKVENGQIEIKGKLYPIKLKDGYYIIRKLTCLEAERLMTLPDSYTAAPGVSNSARYRGCGNGWVAEVIIYHLQHGLRGVSRNCHLKVLSLYDGIGTARYCLDKLGFKDVEYKAYEVEKNAIKIAQYNYPDIQEYGDAFAVREESWNYELFT